MRKIFARKPSKRPSQFDTPIRTQIHFRGALSKTDISFSLCGDAVDSLPMRSTLSQRRLSTTLHEIYRQHPFPWNFFVPFSYTEEQLFVERRCSNFNQVSSLRKCQKDFNTCDATKVGETDTETVQRSKIMYITLISNQLKKICRHLAITSEEVIIKRVHYSELLCSTVFKIIVCYNVLVISR